MFRAVDGDWSNGVRGEGEWCFSAKFGFICGTLALLCDFTGLEHYELSAAVPERAIDRADFSSGQFLKDPNGGGNYKKNTSNITKYPGEQENVIHRAFKELNQN